MPRSSTTCGGGGAGCFQGCLALFRVPVDHAAQREDFENIVSFLATVPLLRKQLPRSELPKVAQKLRRKVWKPGQVLIRQGETGRALFLIMSGRARVVVTSGSGEPENTRCELFSGDYFGGHTLTTSRPNVATIIAAEDGAELVTLSMSRTTFEESGLRSWLTFPKRPAIYADTNEAGAPTTNATSKTPEEEEFIRNALLQNANVRGLLHCSRQKLEGLVAAAERRTVKKGTVVAQLGEMGHEFFVIREGSFGIDLQEPYSRDHSAEAAVARSTMADRLIRKQTFLQTLHTPRDIKYRSSAVSPAAVNGDDCRLLRSVTEGEDFDRQSLKKLTMAEENVSRPMSVATPPSAHRALKQPRQGKRHSVSAVPTFTPCEPLEQEELELGPGDSFGELSLLYNTMREANFTALDESVVYVVGRAAFMTVFSERHQRFTEYCKVLDEVHALSYLLSAERWELACNAHGVVNFKPGERILTQGKRPDARLWYVVLSGSGVQTTDRLQPDGSTQTVQLTHLRRGTHFGERSLLRGDSSSQMSVDAGPGGLSCLTFVFETIDVVLRKVFTPNGTENLPGLNSSIEEYITSLEQGWSRQTSDSITGKERQTKVKFENLIKVCPLGRGGFCKVNLVMDSATSRRYALKTLSKGFVMEKGAERQIRWERELLSMVNCPFIIKLHHTYMDDQHIYFLLEAALGGSLVEVIQRHSEIMHQDGHPHGWAAAFYAACIASALQHLHERKIVHRDVKPENALLDKRGYAKLCDMGFARFVLGKTSTLCGTPEYMAPEMIDFPHTHDTNVDWWGLGVLTFEMLAAQTPFEDEGISEPRARLLAIRRSQEQGSLLYPFNFPHTAKSFVSALLQRLPHRLGVSGGAASVLGHAFFGSMKFNFEEFRAQTMESPFNKEWSDESLLIQGDDFGMDPGHLGLEPGDSIFFPNDAGSNISFGRELS